MKPERPGVHDPAPAPPAPDVARGVFPSERLDLAQRFADLLADAGVVRGLIGPREAPRLWDRHLVNCALLESLLPQGARVADIGSGAGLPGLVLAIVRPDLELTLVEPLLRRTTFLEEAVAALGLARVQVVRGRAESLHGAERYDVVTSRAVAPLERLLRWSMPLVEPHGALVAMKGSSVDEEIAAAADTLAALGCAAPETSVLGAGLVERPTHAVRVVWADPGKVSWPPPSGQSGEPGRAAGRTARRTTRRGRRHSERRRQG